MLNQFWDIEKQEEIERGNSVLLKKLVEIQTSKKKYIAGSQSVSQMPELRSKSLHFGARKMEQERIDRENYKIAQQIYNL